MIFVFGSNRYGIHAAGAALHALNYHGAIWRNGEGLQGKSYAIPTKSTPTKSMTIEEISKGVTTFIRHVKENPQETFFVTAVGTGLAGFDHGQIAPLFEGLPKNTVIPVNWFYKFPQHAIHENKCFCQEATYTSK